jgi:hypothetical protein
MTERRLVTDAEAEKMRIRWPYAELMEHLLDTREVCVEALEMIGSFECRDRSFAPSPHGVGKIALRCPDRRPDALPQSWCESCIARALLAELHGEKP